MSALLVTEFLTEMMGYAGILVSASVFALFVVFGVATYAYPEQRKFLVPMICMFAGGVVDRWIMGGALISSITELDLSNPEKIVSLIARGGIFLACMALVWNAYRTYSHSLKLSARVKRRRRPIRSVTARKRSTEEEKK